MGSTVGARTIVQRFTLISLAEEYAVERYPVLKSTRMTGKGSILLAKCRPELRAHATQFATMATRWARRAHNKMAYYR